MRITLRSSDTSIFHDHRGGPVWDSNVFSKSVTYWPTLSKFKEGPVKKNTLYQLRFCPFWTLTFSIIVVGVIWSGVLWYYCFAWDLSCVRWKAWVVGNPWLELFLCCGISSKHCQRHNGPESWVHITGSQFTNLDHVTISESQSINFKISTKHQHLLTKPTFRM